MVPREALAEAEAGRAAAAEAAEAAGEGLARCREQMRSAAAAAARLERAVEEARHDALVMEAQRCEGLSESQAAG